MGFAVVAFESILSSVAFRRPFETRILSGLSGIMAWVMLAFLVFALSICPASAPGRSPSQAASRRCSSGWRWGWASPPSSCCCRRPIGDAAHHLSRRDARCCSTACSIASTAT